MWRLAVLTDRRLLPPGRGLVETLRACAAAGLPAVLVREHDLPAADRRELMAEVAALDPRPAVISSRIPDPAAAGLHLASGQPAPRPGAPFGRSCHGGAEVRRAAGEGASWATLSPYAPSLSKPGYGPPVPAAEYAGHPIPVLALGGITLANAAAARDAGAHGVAVMGAVMRAPDPAAVVAALLQAVS